MHTFPKVLLGFRYFFATSAILIACGRVGALGAEPTTAPAASASQLRENSSEGDADSMRALWKLYLSHSSSAKTLTAQVAPIATPPEQIANVLASTTPFADPPEIRATNKVLRAILVAVKAHNQIGADKVYLRSYNGLLVGPTLRAHPGDELRITLRNDMGTNPALGDGLDSMNKLDRQWNTTNLHTHGLHVSPERGSDDVLLEIPPGSTEEYDIKIPSDHPCGTFWYHAHKHGGTAAQVSSGMSGALIIEGGLDNVREIAAARERIFVLQQIAYYNDNLPEGVIEPAIEDQVFGPGQWPTLGRYTTVNGVVLPVISLRPGELERWRLIHSGVRSALHLQLEPADMNARDAKALPVYEIANDGLPLGKIVQRDQVDLYPGYRADVLVQAPLNVPAEGSTYLLVEAPVSASESLDGKPSQMRYVAKVIIRGEVNPMALPTNDQVNSFRPMSISPSEVTGHQQVTYGIRIDPNTGAQFTITDDKGVPQQYSEGYARQLTLDSVDEWTVSVDNAGLAQPDKPFPLGHPFHIHTNPIEVFSIVDAEGHEKLTEPVWRDTIFVPDGGKVKFRTRYKDFTGEFVQHCHILDHEDQGMMQNVMIVPKAAAVGNRAANPVAAPAWTLPDSTGAKHKSSEYLGTPTVIFFYLGQGCEHCRLQLAAFERDAYAFKSAGARVVGISSESVAALKANVKNDTFPFTLLADPDLNAFCEFSCVKEKPLHGVFLLDAAGRIRWSCVSELPIIKLDTVLNEITAGDLHGLTSGEVSPAVVDR